jgi:ATP-binding cassette subfamily B protein
LLWLEDLVERRRRNATGPPPSRLGDGITLEDVSFRYPGVDQPLVLEHVDLHLPAGSVVAVVGENGAGKSTLVKLLAKLYEPTDGRILVDGVDLATIDAVAWRDRMAGAFQDFVRFELPAQSSVGLGDLPRVDDPVAVTGAVARAGAVDVIERLPDGLSTQLGPSWPGGVDLSGRGSGRSWRWLVGSCGRTRCSSSSTSRRPPSTPRPSTRCSSASPSRPGWRPRPGA